MLLLASLLIRYGLVVDCGSTSTKIYAYTWDETRAVPEVQQHTDPSVSLPSSIKTPLSNAVRDTSAVQTIFSALLSWAKATVPSEYHSSTNIFVYGTSSMRKLDLELQTKVMDEVRSYIVKDGTFTLPENSTRVISEVDETAYEWVAANAAFDTLQLQDKLVRHATLSIGSSNANFASEIEESQESLDTYVHKVSFGSKNMLLFVKSFNGYGIDEAIAKHVVDCASRAGRANVESPCFNKGWKGEIEGIAVTGNGDYAKCSEMMANILKNEECGHSKCMFEGVPRVIYPSVVGISTMYYTREFFQLSEDAKISEYDEKGLEFCQKDFDTVMTESSDNSYAYRFCFYTAYANYFLRYGLGATDNTKLLIVDEVNGQKVSFALGAVLTHVFPSEADIRDPLTWYEIVIVVLICVTAVGGVVWFIMCCVKKCEKEKEERNKIYLLGEQWMEDDADEKIFNEELPAEQQFAGMFLKVCNVIRKNELLTAEEIAQRKMGNMMKDLVEKMDPAKVLDGTAYRPKTDEELFREKLTEGFDALGNVELQKPKTEEKFEEAVQAGFDKMMNPDLDDSVKPNEKTIEHVLEAAVDTMQPDLKPIRPNQTNNNV